MHGYFSYILAFLPILSQVSVLSRCDASIVMNIAHSNLTGFPSPKIGSWSGKTFEYTYVATPYRHAFVSSNIAFEISKDNKTVNSTINKYLAGPDKRPTSVTVAFTDIYDDDIEINARGFIDGPKSNIQVYVWIVQGAVVVYYCSLDNPCTTGTPLFALSSLTPCMISPDQLQACQDSIKLVNNNVDAPLSRLRDSPNCPCDI